MELNDVLTAGELSMQSNILIYSRLKKGTFDSPGLPPVGDLISVFAVPHHGGHQAGTSMDHHVVNRRYTEGLDPLCNRWW